MSLISKNFEKKRKNSASRPPDLFPPADEHDHEDEEGGENEGEHDNSEPFTVDQAAAIIDGVLENDDRVGWVSFLKNLHLHLLPNWLTLTLT